MKLFLSVDHFIDTEQPLDLSIPLLAGKENLRAWYVDPPKMEPVRANGFVGAVSEGGSVNFRDIFFNPHGHGTHTECLGHITETVFSVNKTLRSYMCKAQLVTVEPTALWNHDQQQEDRVILKEQFDNVIWDNEVDALIIRTLPNSTDKKHMDYSSSNPPYLSEDMFELVEQLNIKHLLIDLPSVDREMDGGELRFHHMFWGVPMAPNHERTITELIYVREDITDGIYVLDLQVAPFENDASPSRPVLYRIQSV